MTDEDSIELRLQGKSEDGSHLELTDGDGNSYSLRISDNLKSTVNAPRLSAVVAENEVPTYSVKDIQNRLRSGETMDAISRTTDWPIEKIEKFAGPILQERAYVIETALKSRIKKDPKSPLLGEITNSQLTEHGVDIEQVEWNTHRKIDGTWNLVVQYPTRNGVDQANWGFDLTNRSLEPLDDAASWLIGEGIPERPKLPTHGFISPTDPPRLVSVKEEIVIKETVYETEAEDVPFDFEDETPPKTDGVSQRAKLPSWDDIMFGSNKPTEE
jgi:hypothetical protein